MTETALITNSDIRTVRNLSATFSADRLNGYILEAQRMNLQDLLGQGLYLDFVNNISSSKYQTLLNGEEYEYAGYTINYYGIKKYLIYVVLGILAREGDIWHSNIGNREYNDDRSNKTNNVLANSYMSTASDFGNGIKQYLDTKSATYPLWEGNSLEIGSDYYFNII